MNRTAWAVVTLVAVGLALVLWFLTYLVPVELRQYRLPPAMVFFWLAVILLATLGYVRRENSRLRDRVRALEAERRSVEEDAFSEDAFSEDAPKCESGG